MATLAPAPPRTRTAEIFYPDSDGQPLPDDAEELIIYRPDGERFKSYVELVAERDVATARAERLAAKLRELGVEPD